MRIERLDLVAFGNFSDRVLDLSAPGLQVVYGPNEAGKTTARAAITNLLYDFDVRTTYAFVHPMTKLQIGARVRGEDATTLDVVRYKRNKDPLVEAGSSRAVSASTWAGLLQGVSRSDFGAMFTLGWEELVQGTSDLLGQDGVLGETLFAAGLGVRALGSVLEHLDAEAATLFSARPSGKTVNTALRLHDEARRHAAELSVRPAHYAEVLKEHDKAAARQDQIAEQRLLLEREHDHLVTLRGVLPTIRVRTSKLEERAGLLGQGPVPPASWAERVRLALEARSELTRERVTACEQVESAKHGIGALSVDEALLDIAERADVLAEGIAAYTQGRSDRSGLDEGRRDAERDALGVVRVLTGGSPGVADLEHAREVLSGKEGFVPARDEWTARVTTWERALEAVRDIEREITELRDLTTLVPDDDPGNLRAAVDAARRQGDLDGALATARSALASAQSQRLELASRLGLAEEEIASAVARPSPSAEEVQVVLDAVDAAVTSARAADERAKIDARREGELSDELDALAVEMDLPSEEELVVQRQVRDTAWTLVKAAWLEHQAVTGDGTVYADERALASSYEQAGRDADGVVDQLWRAADWTARRNGLTTELRRVRAARAAALEESRRSTESAAAAYDTWRSSWVGHRLPETPGALRQWAANLDRLRTLEVDWRAARLAHRETFRNLRVHRGRLGGLLSGFGVDVTAGPDLEPVLSRAEAVLDDIEKVRSERSERERRRQVLERSLPTKQADADAAALAERAAAADLASRLGIYAAHVASPRDAGDVLARLDQLDRLLDTRDNRLQRIRGIDQRTEAFELELRQLLGRAPDIAPEPAADAARELVRRVQAARDAAAARATLEAGRARAQGDLDNADATLAGLREELVLLGAEGGIHDPELLAATADRARRVAELDGELHDIDTLLASQGGGRPISELEADGLGRDLAELNAAIEASKEARTALSKQADQAADTERDLARQLHDMDGSDAAATEAARAQSELARAIEAAERYTRVVLARHIADEAIRRYSDAHQDPLLARASRYLQVLTDGRYRGIGASDDPKKGPLLGVLSPDGVEHGLPHLSDGTRDQLYFALRLAAIEEAIGRSGPMPVVLDDILVNFDDSRARAALHCLAALATSSQVLLFTHHRHVLALAAEELEEKELSIHELSLAAGPA